jgi:hypothetical protein
MLAAGSQINFFICIIACSDTINKNFGNESLVLNFLTEISPSFE